MSAGARVRGKGRHRAGPPDWLGAALIVVPALLIGAALVVAVVEIVLATK